MQPVCERRLLAQRLSRRMASVGFERTPDQLIAYSQHNVAIGGRDARCINLQCNVLRNTLSDGVLFQMALLDVDRVGGQCWQDSGDV